MPTNKPFPKENKKYIMEKSDNVRLFRKPGLFVPIKIEKKPEKGSENKKKKMAKKEKQLRRLSWPPPVFF